MFDFHVRKPAELAGLCGQFFKYLVPVLKGGNIHYEDKVLARYIMEMAPDWRGIINNLQGYSKSGEITSDILSETPDALVEHIKNKRWDDVRDWVFEHSYLHPKQLEMNIYKSLDSKLKNESKPMTVLIFSEYSDKILLGADPSITLLALCTRIMMEVEFK